MLEWSFNEQRIDNAALLLTHYTDNLLGNKLQQRQDCPCSKCARLSARQCILVHSCLPVHLPCNMSSQTVQSIPLLGSYVNSGILDERLLVN